MTELTEKNVLQGFGDGLDCSQQVLAAVASQVNISESTARKLASAFGAGMGHADTCGCVTGAYIALGLKYGHSMPKDAQTKATLMAKKKEFEERFTAQHGSCICRKILGYDLTKPEEMQKIQEQNLLATICPKLVISATNIVSDILNSTEKTR